MMAGITKKCKFCNADKDKKTKNNNHNHDNERCRKCLKVFSKQDCISCTTCKKWFHFKCSNLNSNDFLEHVKDEGKKWECKYCIANKCKRYDKIVHYRHNSICCDLCEMHRLRQINV